MARGTVTGSGTPVLHAAASVGSGRHACVRRQSECGSNPSVLHLSSARGLHDTGHCLRAKFVVAGTRAAVIRVPVFSEVRYRATLREQGQCIKCRRLPIAPTSQSRCLNCLERAVESAQQARKRQGAMAQSQYLGTDRRRHGKTVVGALTWALVQHRERMEGYGE